jgi:peptidyl-prolyl cis-trans isomerase A (cyclophilin A)
MRKLVIVACCLSTIGGIAQTAAPAAKNPTAVIKTSEGDFTCELYKDKVPGAVDNFISLAKGTKAWRDPVTRAMKRGKPLYDGTTFHRVIPQFMVQGGDPMGNGQGGSGFPIKDEYSPDLKFDKPGVLAYANSGPNTNESQFFITEVAVPTLDPCLDAGGCNRGGRHVPKGYGYTIFGQCTPVSLVSRIARAERDANDKPYKPIKILHVAIEGAGEPAKAGTAAGAPKAGTTAKKPATTPKQ